MSSDWSPHDGEEAQEPSIREQISNALAERFNPEGLMIGSWIIVCATHGVGTDGIQCLHGRGSSDEGTTSWDRIGLLQTALSIEGVGVFMSAMEAHLREDDEDEDEDE